jgi:hypothetical protein
MVNVLVWSEVDISSISGGVMVNVLVSSEVDISSKNLYIPHSRPAH